MSDDDAVESLFTGGAILLLGLVVELGISFVAKVIIAQELGRFDYGVVSLGIITAAISSTLVLLGLNTGIARFLPRSDDPAERRGVLVSGFQMAVPLSILIGIAVSLGAPVLADLFGNDSLVPVFRIFGVAIPFGAVMKLSIGSVQGLKQSVPRVVIHNFTFPLVRFGGIVIAVLLGAGVFGVSLAFLASYVFAAFVGLYFVATRSSLFDRSVEFRTMHRKLVRFSLPLVVTAAMTVVLSDIDMYMLAILRGPGVVGEYNVIYPLAQLLTTALSAFGFLMIPELSEKEASGAFDEAERLYQVTTKWVVMVTLPPFLVMALFPARTISLTFGAEYVGAAPALSILSTGFFLHSVFGLNKGALTSIGQTRVIMYDDIAAAAANVMLNLALIPPFGLVGAAWATLLSYVLLNGLYTYQLYERTSIHPFTVALVKPILIALTSMAAIYYVARTYLVITPVTLVGLFVLFGVVYVLAILRFGVEEEEVMLVLSFEERLGVDLGPLKSLAERLM